MFTKIETKLAETIKALNVVSNHPDYSELPQSYYKLDKVTNLRSVEQHVVVHDRENVNDEGYHTNTVEKLWRGMKGKLSPRYGCLRCNRDEFVDEYIFVKRTIVR